MLVSNNSLLNILLPNENKVLKDVLKEADAKTLSSLKNGNTTVGDILKNMFNDLKTGSKNSANIKNILKNSNLFKDLGSFTKSVTTLLNQIDADSNLSKYKPLLQSFLKDISLLDDKSLKDLIQRSGIFLESKSLEQATKGSNLPKNLETILVQIKNVLKDIPSLEAKKIESLIDKILQNNSNTASKSLLSNEALNNSSKQNVNSQNSLDFKSLVSMLQNLSKNVGDKQVANLTQLTNQLKNISNEAQLLESKTSNQVQTDNKQNINVSQNQTNLTSTKESIISNTKEVLFQLKNELLLARNIPNSPNIVKQIDTLLQSNNLFAKNDVLIEPKNLLSQLTNLSELKTAANQNTNIASLVTNLKNQVETINTLENKALVNQNITSEKIQITQDLNQTLSSLKTELLNVKNVDTKLINQIIDKLLNLQNIFNKIELPVDLKNFQQTLMNQTSSLNNFQSNFSSNINNLILSLKEAIVNLSSNQNSNLAIQQNIFKIVDKLEATINNFLQNSSSPILNDKQVQNPLQNDMKAILLQIQEELSTKPDAKSNETLKQVDRMIMQVEYYQLLSATSNSNSVYIPFIWDMLDDGSISMKKLDEEKFFCEINISLKEFGQTQLLLSLYDKNKLDLTVYASKEEFKQSIRENSSKLKQALNSVGLIPVNINIIDLKKEKSEEKSEPSNIYNQNVELGLGINIKA